MGKLVIKFQGKVVREVNLKLGDTTIGRKPGCDIFLDDPIVSGEHALIKTVGMKSTIQDLDSKNGTFVGTQRVRQHELKHGETIILGGHSLVYRDDAVVAAPAFGKQAATPAVNPGDDHSVTTEMASFAQLVAVDGSDKGKRIPLVKDTITLENPGKNPGRITRTRDGFLFEAQVGPGEPRLNDKPLQPGGQFLEEGDIIDVAGTKFKFSG